MTANQIAFQRLKEEERHDVVSEQNDYNKAVAALMQAGASQKQAEAALQNAAANASKAETERNNFWLNVANQIATHMGLTPMSSSEITKNIGSAVGGGKGLMELLG